MNHRLLLSRVKKSACMRYMLIFYADEAIAIASAWPGGGAVEIRPLLEE
jgi:hypothetical protein